MIGKRKESTYAKYRVLKKIATVSYIILLTVVASFAMPKIISKGATFISKRRRFTSFLDEDPIIVRNDQEIEEDQNGS